MQTILIVSEQTDLTTDKVIEWLQFDQKHKIIRINENDLIVIDEIKPRLKSIKISHHTLATSIDLKGVLFFWYRRGNLNRNIDVPIQDLKTKKELWEFLNWEWVICRNYIMSVMKNKSSLGNYFKSTVNKLQNLEYAHECGFKIPETIVSESSKISSSFIRKRSIITKAIGEAMSISQSNSFIDLSTSVVNKITMEIFYPSLLQERIDKWIELRVFVSYDEIYAMAIFSQGNSKTDIDYRNYDRENPNRFVPFHLPKDIEERVLQFMNISGLDTGSIDFILTPEKEYIFLEINPAGNIEMVSEPCNYYLEKRIAEQILERIPL
ncbi:grasp-with-spasm system ATP-grasp peptide maturase [Labilibaculum manganireducens]|uniref:grasp-with-spasm system ATP-grasp peptide maturase n=1 Tax=Labilibaculum manganireducens TaxID=1940525 RepID=UPI0029F5B4C5|nr:grasp-with-spasm system ATP-grasp peptide maturase [Labilibaculum manganireducens]